MNIELAQGRVEQPDRLVQQLLSGLVALQDDDRERLGHRARTITTRGVVAARRRFKTTGQGSYEVWCDRVRCGSPARR